MPFADRNRIGTYLASIRAQTVWQPDLGAILYKSSCGFMIHSKNDKKQMLNLVSGSCVCGGSQVREDKLKLSMQCVLTQTTHKPSCHRRKIKWLNSRMVTVHSKYSWVEQLLAHVNRYSSPGHDVAIMLCFLTLNKYVAG